MDKRGLLKLSVIAVTLNGCGGGASLENTVTFSGKDVRKKALEDILQAGRVEDIAPQGLHRIRFDLRNCQDQNASPPASIPIPGGNDIANYPLPLGFPLSNDLGNLPACIPDLQLTSLQANNGQLITSFFQFDPLAKSWATRQDTHDNKLQLSDNGTWVSVDRNNSQISFSEDGTAILVNGNKQQQFMIQVADLSGKPLSLTYSGDDQVLDKPSDALPAEANYENQIATIAAQKNFPQGALAIRRSFTQLNTSYEIPNTSCQNSEQTFNGNCNVIRKPDGNAANAINADMFFTTESTPSNTQYSLKIGAFNIQLQLKSEQAADFFNTNSGPVRFIPVDSTTSDKTIETGQWSKRNIKGVDLYIIELPRNTHDDSGNNTIKTIFFAEQNGYVRQGVLSSEGDIQIEDNWFVNNEALDSLTSLLQSL